MSALMDEQEESLPPQRWAWIRLKSHGCWVWMAIPHGEPYPDPPPPGCAKRGWHEIGW